MAGPLGTPLGLASRSGGGHSVHHSGDPASKRVPGAHQVVISWQLEGSQVEVGGADNDRSVDCQAPLSMGFSRHEYWSGLPCPLLGDLEGKQRTPFSSRVVTGISWSPLSGLKGVKPPVVFGKRSRKQSSLSGKESAQGCTPKRWLGRPDEALGGGTQARLPHSRSLLLPGRER